MAVLPWQCFKFFSRFLLGLHRRIYHTEDNATPNLLRQMRAIKNDSVKRILSLQLLGEDEEQGTLQSPASSSRPLQPRSGRYSGWFASWLPLVLTTTSTLWPTEITYYCLIFWLGGGYYLSLWEGWKMGYFFPSELLFSSKSAGYGVF